MTYSITFGGGEYRADRHAWKSDSRNIAVRDDDTGQIVAWYERKKEYRCVSQRAEFLVAHRLADRRPIWRGEFSAPAGHRTLRDWFLSEVEARFGLTQKRAAS